MRTDRDTPETSEPIGCMGYKKLSHIYIEAKANVGE